MEDQWNIPDHILGPIDDGFAGAIGRVAMLSAVLEECLLYLLWSITDRYQHEDAGRFGQKLTELIRKANAGLPCPLADRIASFVLRADQAREDRNITLHSCYPNATLNRAFQWRSLPTKQRSREKDFNACRELTRDDLQAQIADLVALIESAGPLASEASFEFQRSRNGSSRPARLEAEDGGD